MTRSLKDLISCRSNRAARRYQGSVDDAIGIHGSAGYSIIFDDPNDIINFLPATGAPGPLTADLLDPATSAAGSYGGEVATLEVNVAFNDASILKGNLGSAIWCSRDLPAISPSRTD
jgi:hypothetical protein